MTAQTYSKNSSKARRARYAAALERPELRGANDGFERRASAGPTSAPIKVQDEATRVLIEAALHAGRKRHG